MFALASFYPTFTRPAEIEAQSKPFDEAIALLTNLKYNRNDPMTFPDLELYCSNDAKVSRADFRS
jgi:hypothetical protein